MAHYHAIYMEKMYNNIFIENNKQKKYPFHYAWSDHNQNKYNKSFLDQI